MRVENFHHDVFQHGEPLLVIVIDVRMGHAEHRHGVIGIFIGTHISITLYKTYCKDNLEAYLSHLSSSLASSIELSEHSCN